MSEVSNLLTPENVLVDVSASCKRDLLSYLAEFAAGISELPQEEILATLSDREKLGSTGVGSGIAIPHGKIKGVEGMVGGLVRLAEPIDFDAVDDQPVDLVFLLLAPQDANAVHLKTLSKIARMMRNEEVRAAMRGASTAEALYAIAIEQEKPRAA